MDSEDSLTLTTGKDTKGRKLAIISSGGHPQLDTETPCTVLKVEIVDGWGKGKIAAWFERMKTERPWESRH